MTLIFGFPNRRPAASENVGGVEEEDQRVEFQPAGLFQLE
jgi:hypothetical protein